MWATAQFEYSHEADRQRGRAPTPNAAMGDKSKYGSNLASFHAWLSLYIFWRRKLTDITLPQYFRAHQHPAEISRDAPAEPRVRHSKLSADYMETDRASRAHFPALCKLSRQI